MNKDEMIKELKAIIQREHSDCMSRFCDHCEYYAMKYCGSVKKATALYNANCRIIGEDEQVVKTEQLNETLNSTLESGKRMGYARGRDEAITAVLKYIDNTIKGFNIANEEANKGLDEDEKELKSMCADAILEVLRIIRDDLARIYGIEIEEE